MVAMKYCGNAIKKGLLIIGSILLLFNIILSNFYFVSTHEEIVVSASSTRSRGSSPWTKCADMPTGQTWLTSVTIDDKIYAILGTNDNCHIECYDPSTNSWSTFEKFTTPRWVSSSCVLNNKIYLIGGWDGENRLNTVECYDPLTDNLSKCQDIPTARSGLTCSVVNDKIYAFGGYNGDYLVTVECYYPLTDTWSTCSNILKARSQLTSAVVKGKIYLIGGGNEKELSNVECYDPLTDSYTSCTSMPTPRNAPSCGVVDNKIYVFGGRSQIDSESWNMLSNVECYDPSTDSWFRCTDMPTGRAGSTAQVVNNKIYIIGGSEQEISSSHTVERYDPQLDTLVPIEIDEFLDYLTSFDAILIYVTISSLMVILSSIFIGTEVGKYAFFSALNPLYTKERKRKTGEYGNIKRSIRGYITSNPGHNYNLIKRKLNLPNGTLAYNLNTLERDGSIKSERDGFHRRFYPGEVRFVKETFDFTDIQQSIYNVIKENPGISQTDIASQLYISIQRLNYNIQLMVAARIIRLEREGNKSKCFLIDDFERL